MSSVIPEGWKKLKMGNIGTFSTSSVNKESKDNEISVSLLNYMDIYQNCVLSSSYRFQQVTAPAKQVTSSSIRNGDVFFTPSSETPNDIGHSAVFLGDAGSLVHSYHTIRFRLNEDDYFDDNYKAYAFKEEATYEYFLKRATGSTRFTISLPIFNELEVLAPPLPEQKKIASILTSVDEVIENTQKQIDKLQDLKKATMNELLTKGIDHTEFKDSELGRIPESWKIKSLLEISELSRGKFSHRPRNDPAFYDGHYPFLQTGDIPVDNLEITSFTQSLNDRGLEVSKLFPEGTLVLTIAATIGEIGLLKFDSCFPDSLVGIIVNQALMREYFLLFSLRYWKERLILQAPESAQKNLNLDLLNSFHVAVPPLNEQKEIESILISIQNHIDIKNNELSQTQSLKKSLMQDLLTGKVRVTVN